MSEVHVENNIKSKNFSQAQTSMLISSFENISSQIADLSSEIEWNRLQQPHKILTV